MLKITFKSGRRYFSQGVNEVDYPAPPGVDLAHWARPLTITGDDVLDIDDHLVAEFAQELLEAETCPEFLLDCGPEGCEVTVEVE